MTARTVRTATAMATAAVVLASAAACSAPEDGGGPGGGTDGLTVGVAQEPETLSPLLGYGKEGNSKIFDGLLTHDAQMNLKPALATHLPKVSEDGRTYTYDLRKGVTFSDGKPFTAKDVVYTYETILDKKTNNASKSELDAVDSVRAASDHTVVFRLKYPYAAFAERTVLPIASKAVASKTNVNTGSYNTEPVGTGPYVLTSWRKGEKLSFKANPRYWGGKPKIKRLTVAVIEDDDVRATRLRSGDLDGAILPPNLAKAYEKDEAKRTFSAKTADYRAVTLPSDNPVTGDKAIRRALDLAVDRKAMVKSVLNGAGKPAYGPLPTDSPWFADGTERPHDLDEAKKILDDAGWKPGKDGVRRKDGERAAFTLWYFSGDKLRQDHALAYASDAKKAGIDVHVQAGSREVIRPKVEHDAMLLGNGFPADPDFDLYPTLHSSQAGNGWNNLAYYHDKTVDEQLDAARRSRDPQVRKAAYAKAQRALAGNPGYTFLTTIDHVYVIDDKWRGLTTQVEPHDHGIGAGPWWNVQDWQPKK
ncbi:ABC transporter substrate-binding protein [Streptomyces reniochalinae]|uniref:ABC transporter substrate-binding protein n=1 Tax=Streptomyces reniochalinae TaxID=2250578 RepID=A0A367EBK4_9ACTN|nr:ABC transporter substrate-binding protein [Streptomyces reniochalinae]RCG15411.1 ABC transporter substrate-binding protein [Streptomyces reniochalinae]